MQFLKKPEVRIAMIFFIIGTLWIIFSDKFFLLTSDNLTAEQLTIIQTFKGVGFVTLVSFLLYFLVKKSGKKFTKSQNEYNQLFRNNPNPMWIYDTTDLSFLKVNNAAIDKYGYSEKEFYAMTILDIRPSEDVAALRSVLNNLKDVLPDNGIWRHRKKNGEIIRVHISSQQFVFNKKPCRLVLVNDITKLQLLEEDLSKTNSELNVVLNSITDGFFIINKDFTIIKSNNELRNIAEVKTDNIIGKPFFELFPGSRGGFSHQQYLKALNTNQSVHFESFNAGTHSWSRVSAYPYENGLSVFFRNITKEKENELSIIQNEQNLNALINNTEDLIWSIDSDFRYHTFNEPYKKRYIQLFNDDLYIGKLALSEKRGLEYMQTWKALYQRALNGEAFSTDMAINVLNEGVVHVNTRFNPIYNSGKEVVGVGCFLQDITERKIYETRIEQQNKKLKDIAFITSHTVRAPLANLLGLIEAIDRSNPTDPINLQMIDHIKTSAENLDVVIKDIVSQTVQIKQDEINQAS